MINNNGIWLIGIISVIVILSLTFAVELSQSESTVKSKQSFDDNSYPELKNKVLQYMGKLGEKYTNAKISGIVTSEKDN